VLYDGGYPRRDIRIVCMGEGTVYTVLG